MAYIARFTVQASLFCSVKGVKFLSAPDVTVPIGPSEIIHKKLDFGFFLT
jgi:hypothetical protein